MRLLGQQSKRCARWQSGRLPQLPPQSSGGSQNAAPSEGEQTSLRSVVQKVLRKYKVPNLRGPMKQALGAGIARFVAHYEAEPTRHPGLITNCRIGSIRVWADKNPVTRRNRCMLRKPLLRAEHIWPHGSNALVDIGPGKFALNDDGRPTLLGELDSEGRHVHRVLRL